MMDKPQCPHMLYIYIDIKYFILSENSIQHYVY